jgi:hypothetical protein
MFKATLILVKFVKKNAEVDFTEYLAKINEWSEIFWDHTLCSKVKRHIFKTLSESVKSLYSLTNNGKGLKFLPLEEYDSGKIFSQNIEKLIDHASHNSLENHEEWAVKHELRTLLNQKQTGEESVEQKVCLALKRSPVSLSDIISLFHSRQKSSKQFLK